MSRVCADCYLCAFIHVRRRIWPKGEEFYVGHVACTYRSIGQLPKVYWNFQAHSSYRGGLCTPQTAQFFGLCLRDRMEYRATSSLAVVRHFNMLNISVHRANFIFLRRSVSVGYLHAYCVDRPWARSY